MKGLWIFFVVLVFAKSGFAASASDIVAKAKSYIGSESWTYDSEHEVAGSGTNKCNLFVADVLREVGAPAPDRHFWFYSPIGANEWGDADSGYLSSSPCWDPCTGGKQPGDVIAEGGHVGIVTEDDETTSASANASPRGKVVENDWGFRSGQNPTCWRYDYDYWRC